MSDRPEPSSPWQERACAPRGAAAGQGPRALLLVEPGQPPGDGLVRAFLEPLRALSVAPDSVCGICGRGPGPSWWCPPPPCSPLAEVVGAHLSGPQTPGRRKLSPGAHHDGSRPGSQGLEGEVRFRSQRVTSEEPTHPQAQVPKLRALLRDTDPEPVSQLGRPLPSPTGPSQSLPPPAGGSSQATPLRPGSSQATPLPPGSSQATPLRPGSSQATPLPPGSSQATPLPPGSSQATPLPPGSSQATPLPPGSSQATPLPPGSSQATPLPPGSSQATPLPPGSSQATPLPPGSSQATPLPPGSSQATPLPPGSSQATPLPPGSSQATPLPPGSSSVITC
ncbi:basic proline-rich protein-like [Dipodomys spectabilis]|uniref:basic proline-rich protein-like n=1 Tax=Dipodomys spectabilis TaxID=105255 RepID=UPI001C54B5EA|nr:basic proline-rich protein-like [Dipodomys spectabilis]